MLTKSVKVSEIIIEKSKARRFQSPNQYILHLMEFEEANRGDAQIDIIKSHNALMGFMEMERLMMEKLNSSIRILIEKTEIELQLTEREKAYLRHAMDSSIKEGKWVFKRKD